VVARRARRERISAAFEEFHRAMSTVLGAAARLRDGAAAEHAETMAELFLRQTGLDAARADPGMRVVLHNLRLAGAVGRVAADRATAFDEWLHPGPTTPEISGPQRLSRLMARHAPGAAGDVDGWLGEVGEADGAGPVPQLWRIGTGTVGTETVGDGAFPVGVPLLDESHLQVFAEPGPGERHVTHETRAAAESLVESLLLRVTGYFRPGLVQAHVWDVGQFTGALPGLYPLTRTGLLTVHDPGNLDGLLDELSNRIRRVHTRVLVGGHPSLKALAEQTGGRTEPWVVAVLVGNRAPLGEDGQRQLQRVLRGGLACGISVVMLDVPLTIAAPVETVRLRTGDPGTARRTVATTSVTGPHVTVLPDAAVPREAVTAACHAIVDEHERLRTRVGTFRDLLPADREWWGRAEKDSKSGLHAPIGFVEGLPVEMTLADASPHALVGGPSGTGKTNLLLAMIASLAARYSPDELELYLLDFKEGVSFAQFAPGRRDTTWLPHARLIGVNVNTDREFGLALLQHLADEMRRRAAEAKAHEVTKLEELRAEDPKGRWPRIVAVIDEFQYLFAERDAVTRDATRLLEDVARRGRSQGIHLVLASQDSSIEAFWGRPAVFEQFVLRIGLPRARRVLAELNEATLDLPPWHAVVNHESGIPHGNEIVRIPDATAKDTVDLVQAVLHERFAAGRNLPRLFDGSRAPRLRELLDRVPHQDEPAALVGQCIDVEGSPTLVPLPPVPGRNIGVLSAGGEDAVRVLGAAAASLGERHAVGGAQFVLAPLVAGAAASAADDLRRRLLGHEVDTVRLDAFGDRVLQLGKVVLDRLSTGDRTPIYLVVYAADAADAVLDSKGTDALRKILRFGPETGVHVIGWWRSPLRLKSLLMLTASLDDLGAFLGLDVQGTELGNLIAPGMPLTWSPRPGRALFFDRSRHARPEVVIVPEPGGAS
jgi:DNA segregation ATPase FtsK/SpoIIIE, S-DNA-T family